MSKSSPENEVAENWFHVKFPWKILKISFLKNMSR